MSAAPIQTASLALIPHALDDLRARIESMTPSEKAEVSPDWLARLHAATSADPWIFGFAFVHRASGIVIGMGGFKGPPDADGMVEVAYGVDPAHRGKGYATEAAEALVTYAFNSGQVCVVRAHTLPEPNASGRVLAKCGFQRLGEVTDPDDGLVWRWERHYEQH